MLKTKYKRPIPNPKLYTEPANSPITTYHMDPSEIIRLYGPINPKRKR